MRKILWLIYAFVAVYWFNDLSDWFSVQTGFFNFSCFIFFLYLVTVACAVLIEIIVTPIESVCPHCKSHMAYRNQEEITEFNCIERCFYQCAACNHQKLIYVREC